MKLRWVLTTLVVGAACTGRTSILSPEELVVRDSDGVDTSSGDGAHGDSGVPSSGDGALPGDSPSPGDGAPGDEPGVGDPDPSSGDPTSGDPALAGDPNAAGDPFGPGDGSPPGDPATGAGDSVPGDPVISQTCEFTSECPTGYWCRDDCGYVGTRSCVPRGGEGSVCSASIIDPCFENMCLETLICEESHVMVDGPAFCRLPCADSTGCAADQYCVQAGLFRVCVPDGLCYAVGDCSDAANDWGAGSCVNPITCSGVYAPYTCACD